MRALLLLLLISTYIFGQVEQSRGTNVYSIGPQFYFDVANYQGEEEGKTRVDIFIQVPYSNLQFIKIEDGFKASYLVTLTFFNESKDNIVFEKIWTEKVKVRDFDVTIAKSGHNLSYRSSNLAAGTYYLKCIIEDLDSKRSVFIEKQLEVDEYDNDVELSDIVLVAKRFSDADGEKIIPNVAKIVTTDDKTIDFFFEVYSKEPKSLFVEYKIHDFNDEPVFKELKNYEFEKGRQVIHYAISDPAISLGDYTLIVELQDKDNDVLAAVKKEIRSKLIGFPAVIKNLELAVEQMTYIASREDIETIESGETYNDRLNSFIEYWKAKDPSPNTIENEVLAEYYRRIAYANEHFKSYFDGWRTDMGMIYVTLGPPNQVDRHPFDYDSKPYEVWDYFELNRRFVFVDQTGFGDYRLQNPVYGDWYRYRY